MCLTHLQQTEKDRPGVHAEGLCTVNQDSFRFDGKKWRFAKKGDMVLGAVKAADGGVPGIRIGGEYGWKIKSEYCVFSTRSHAPAWERSRTIDLAEPAEASVPAPLPEHDLQNFPHPVNP